MLHLKKTLCKISDLDEGQIFHRDWALYNRLRVTKDSQADERFAISELWIIVKKM